MNDTPTTQDRLLHAFRELVRAEFPQLTYLGVWDYVVAATDGTTIDATVSDPASPVPQSLTGIPLRPAIPGMTAQPVIGMHCLITFANADPTRPIVVGFDVGPDPDPGDGKANQITLSSTDDWSPVAMGFPHGRMLRYGDTVSIPTIGDVVLAAGSLPTPVSRIKG